MNTIGWMEFAESEIVSEYQVIQLRKAIEYVYKYSKYYNKLLRDHDIKPSDIKKIEDIKKIPFTSKKDLQSHNEDFFCCDYNEASDVVHSSGSTGTKPIINILTRSDLDRLAYSEELSFLCAGVSKNDVFMDTAALDGFYIAGIAYYLGLHRLGSCVLRVGSTDFEQQVSLISKIEITGIVGVPSSLVTLAEHCTNIDSRLAVKKLILIGETIRDKAYNLNSLGKKLSDAWPNAKLISTYGNTELATAFCECPAGNGGHVHPDLCFAEIVDENGSSLDPGEIGDLVVTTFATQGMPLLRYRTGDITFIDSHICSCGRITPRIGPVLGRRENMLKVNGVSVYPLAIEQVIHNMSEIKDFIILINVAESGTDEVEIFVSTRKKDAGFFSNFIINNVRKETRITPKVTFCNDERIKSMQSLSGSRKTRRIIDLR